MFLNCLMGHAMWREKMALNDLVLSTVCKIFYCNLISISSNASCFQSTEISWSYTEFMI